MYHIVASFAKSGSGRQVCWPSLDISNGANWGYGVFWTGRHFAVYIIGIDCIVQNGLAGIYYLCIGPVANANLLFAVMTYLPACYAALPPPKSR